MWLKATALFDNERSKYRSQIEQELRFFTYYDDRNVLELVRVLAGWDYEADFPDSVA